ncbi:MAG: dihydroneopterin aldolase [Nevskiaceae bacterium]|nr:MAG: dihydroneopterin aldolase [Nevskiaceae bacterium]TBR75013.1 MAG: dihydroneopterin aldolase [Nevskiaceae bacterium]
MSDWIRVEGLQVDAPVGVFDWEKRAARPLLVDIELGLDLRPAGASDRLADTIDYAAVARVAAAVAATRHHELIEAYADELARALLAGFPCTAVRVTVHKPGAVPRTRMLSVHVERERNDDGAQPSGPRDGVYRC